MWDLVETSLLGLAISWDLISLVLNLRRNTKGSGSTGVPVLSWLVYLFLVEWRKETFFFASQWQAGFALTVLHILCHFAVPWAHRLIMRRND